MKILPDVAWNFARSTYSTVDEFNQAVADYNTKIMEDRANWQPDKVVVEHPTIDILYECWAKSGEPVADNEELIQAYKDGDYEEREVLVRFSADNEQHFTALELLYKIHQQLRNKELGDHTFFEGLTPDNEQNDGATPIYHLYCGS